MLGGEHSSIEAYGGKGRMSCLAVRATTRLMAAMMMTDWWRQGYDPLPGGRARISSTAGDDCPGRYALNAGDGDLDGGIDRPEDQACG